MSSLRNGMIPLVRPTMDLVTSNREHDAGLILSPLPTTKTTTTHATTPLQTLIPTPLLERIKSPSLWFEDGNIILGAQSTLFKVHKSFLARHSEVFRDLFLVPQPGYLYTGAGDVIENGGLEQDGTAIREDGAMEDEMFGVRDLSTDGGTGGSVGVVSPIGNGETGMLEVLDGLPVVYLSDNETELTHLLNALYDRSYYSKHERTPLKTIAALLRLSTKYGIQDLREDTIQHLSPLYPSTIEDFDALMSHMANSTPNSTSLGGSASASASASISFGSTGRSSTRTTRGGYTHRTTSLSPSRSGYGYAKDRDTSHTLLNPRTTRFDLIEQNDPITVINLARETGADHLLPSALYFCATRSLRQLFASSSSSSREGSGGGSGSSSSNGNGSGFGGGGGGDSCALGLGVSSRLSYRDLEACVVGREKLMRAHRQIVWKFLDSGKDSLREHHLLNYTLSSPTSVSSPITSSSPTTTFATPSSNTTTSSSTTSSTSSACTHETCTRAKMLFMASSAWRHIAYEPDVFEPQDSLINESVLASLCESCLGGLRKSVMQGRRDVWHTLPRYFRLEDWEKLVATA